MADLRLAGACRRSRRRSRPHARPRPPDLRRTVRRSLRPAANRCTAGPRTGERTRRARAAARRERIDGAVRVRVRALRARRRREPHRVEAFALGTRLTRITRELASRDPTPRSPPRPAGRRLVGWHPARRGPARVQRRRGACGAWRAAPIVVILSDGWDRGEPDGARRADGAPRAGSRTRSCG